VSRAASSVAAWLRRRPAAAAALFYLALTLLFLAPALMPGKTLSNSDALFFDPPFVTVKPPGLERPSNPELGDAVEQLQLFTHHTARAFPDIPLWNPYIAGGRPFQANSQSAVFGPYSIPAYVLPFWTALGWIGVMKLWVAAFGTYLLGRALGMRFAGALLAGVVFALNLKLVTWLSYPHMSVWTFLPWLLLLTEMVVRRPGLLTGAGLAAVVALQFLSGHAESSFHVLMTAAAFLVLRLWQARRAGGAGAAAPWRPALTFAAAGLGGAALAAISLIPFAELLWHSADLRNRQGESIDVSLDGREAIGVFLPDYWGRPTQTPIRLFLLERALYVGALPLMLAFAAVVLRPKAERVAVAAYGFLWFAVVLGIPPFLQVVTRLPVFSSGHNSRLIALTMFCLALLAGWGLDEVREAWRAPRRRRQAALGIAALLLVVPLVVVVAGREVPVGALGGGLKIAWLFADPPGEFRNPIGLDVVRMSSLLLWLTFAGAALLLMVLRVRRRLGAVAFATLAVLLVCADLFRAGMGFNPAIDQDVAEVPATGAISYLQRQRPARFAGTNEIPQNVLPFEFGLYEARGYDLPIVRRYDRLWRREVTPDVAPQFAALLNVSLELPEVTPRALRTLRLLGVTHILRAARVRPLAPPFEPLQPYPPLRIPGVTPVYDGPDARVYRVHGALPRAFVVGAQRVVEDGDAQLDAVTGASFDGRRVAITERRIEGVPRERGAGGRASPGTAQITRYEDERVVVHARAAGPGPGVLVLGDTHFPGWQATVDGREVPVERVDYLFRGVRLPPGAHTVEFRYRPLSWRIGWILSLLSLLGLAVAVVAGVARARARRGGPDAPADPTGRVPAPEPAGSATAGRSSA
jgi:hypothetical protein